jgi:hypothetical protein
MGFDSFWISRSAVFAFRMSRVMILVWLPGGAG